MLDNGLAVAGRAAYQLNQRGSGDTLSQSSLQTSARMDAATNFAPDVLYISVGGGFGTVSVGAHAPASCSTMPRPIAFLNGVNSTHYTLFTGVVGSNGTFSESNYCGTPESVSYATPNIGGFKAMLTYAPDNESNQGTDLSNAQDNDANVEDRVDMAAAWSGAMGGANASVGVGYQSGANDRLDSLTVAGTVGFGGFTFGASWFDNDSGPSPHPNDLFAAADAEASFTLGRATEDALKLARAARAWRNEQDGWTVAGKYDIGSLTLGVTYSQANRDRHHMGSGALNLARISSTTLTQRDGAGTTPTAVDNRFNFDLVDVANDVEESALVLGISYAVGGGLTTWIEYMDLEQEYVTRTASDVTITTNADGSVDIDGGTETTVKGSDDDSLFLIGVTLGF